jgi:hypothetical protein
MMSLYNAKLNQDELRYVTYCRKLGAGAINDKKKAVNLATFPPTIDATRQHLLRAYNQVQAWKGEIKDPSQYGWQNSVLYCTVLY